MFDWLFFGAIAVGISYLIARNSGTWERAVIAYFAALIVTFAATFGTLWGLEEIAHMAPIEANRVIGPGIWCALLGPVLGLVWARRQRKKRTAGEDDGS